MKTHFFVFIDLKIVFKGLCVPTSETSCSSYFMKTNIFWKKLAPYVSPGQATRTKMTAIWFSSYELFAKIGDFCWFLQCFVALFMKTHFFILNHLKIVFKGLCVPTSEASCSSYFVKTDRQKPNFNFTLSLQLQEQKKNLSLIHIWRCRR